MIIELSDEFDGFTPQQWNQYEGAIEHLITAHANGWHILTSTRRTADSIQSGIGLSDRQNAIFRSSIYNRIAVLSGQAKAADWTLLLQPDGVPVVTRRLNQIAARLSDFTLMSACLPARLLTEDSAHDGRYFEKLANIVARDLGYGVRLNLDLAHGGGAGVAARYAEVLDENRLSLCVVDSDQRFPGAPWGNTAQGVMDRGVTNERGTVRAYVLPVREAENTIPLSFLFEVYRADAAVREKISRVCAYLEAAKRNNSVANCAGHIDMKDGEEVRHIAMIPLPVKIGMVSMCRQIRHANIDEGEFSSPESRLCAYEGISRNVLRTTLQYLEANPRHEKLFKQKLKRTPFWGQIEVILRAILAFGASDVAIAGR